MAPWSANDSQWNFFELHGLAIEFHAFHGVPSMEFEWNIMEVLEYHGIHRILWFRRNSIQSNAFHGIHRNLWHPCAKHAIPWNPSNSMEIIESHAINACHGFHRIPRNQWLLSNCPPNYLPVPHKLLAKLTTSQPYSYYPSVNLPIIQPTTSQLPSQPTPYNPPNHPSTFQLRTTYVYIDICITIRFMYTRFGKSCSLSGCGKKSNSFCMWTYT